MPDTCVIDCDIHPPTPTMAMLLPYMDSYWRDMVSSRGTDGLGLNSYPPGAPISARADRRDALTLDDLRAQALEPWGTRLAILNPLYGAQALTNADLASVLARAVNNWIAAEWLDADNRLRASIVVSTQDIGLAVEEIERCAADPRFVQVLLLVSDDMPLGRRRYWPVYEAAQRLGLAVGIHAGSNYHNPTTSSGWPSFIVEEYVGQSAAFQSALLSLVAEGVFCKFKTLRVVLIEAGFTWLPSFLWRANKTWRGLRTEVPWVDRPPAEIIRQHIRFTLQPADAPPDPHHLARVVEQMGSDKLILFSTDYPHWQFDGNAALPAGFDPVLARRITTDNPFDTYQRLKETVQ
ncbi:amidohydrolase family protein [Methylobacterium sp. NEAU 140]|uniref:amidohydrolase family protein n=1 Tax=Methylobacterium sp. NEAU 140 TaxID=3064945 RepID=UPI002736FD0A|nr:amidohydrolase family protein [Methylobacterium sp. NEAU 140]MDP4026739.1 amidohydrolase family protein [Methylobacterium sp. NEAU 140]